MVIQSAFRWLVAAMLAFIAAQPIHAQDSTKPLRMPLTMPAGPSTWLFGQPYGNTVGAFNFGTAWYSAGQGLHFGIDISMPCGTPLVAVADGEVIYVDNLAFGAGPHNLILRHPQAGVTTLYGHLLEKPPLQQYQLVQRGQLVGYSGDPDVTCDSRPHLHLEVRSLDYRTAYNPLDYIDAQWDVLTAIGPFNSNLFQQDLTHARRWMRLEDQPPVAFGGARLNAYAQSWPPANDQRQPVSALPARDLGSLPADARAEVRSLGYADCCANFWWHASDSNHFYVIDGAEEQPAAIFEWDVEVGGLSGLIEPAPPVFASPDGTYTYRLSTEGTRIRSMADGSEWLLNTGGFTPAISPDNQQLLWLAQYGTFVPGATPPLVEVWVSGLKGDNARTILSQPRASAAWLDGTRLLIATSERTLTTLSVYNTSDNTSFVLGAWDRLRGLSIAPGGGRLLFYQTFQNDPAANAVYTLLTQPNAQPERLTWFGGWRWRDSNSLYYLPFQPDQALQNLMYYHFSTGENRPLTDPDTQPFTVVNGDWSVSPDGRSILFQNVGDNSLSLLVLSP